MCHIEPHLNILLLLSQLRGNPDKLCFPPGLINYFPLIPLLSPQIPKEAEDFAVENDLRSLLVQVLVEGQKNVGSWKEFVSDSSIKIGVLILPQLTCNDSQEFLSQK